jgi:hypothetical protein
MYSVVKNNINFKKFNQVYKHSKDQSYNFYRDHAWIAGLNMASVAVQTLWRSSVLFTKLSQVLNS